MTTNERKMKWLFQEAQKRQTSACVCELKNICMSPVCDQEFEACSAELNWCRNIGSDGNECAHDEACHQQQEETK